jgi:aminoglycoside N3'-acetyltransferase
MSNRGFILFLGTDFSANTCIHAIEIEARVPGLHTEAVSFLQAIDDKGVLHEIEHHWHAPKLSCYPDLEHLVERAGGLTYGRIGNAICRLVDAAVLRATLLPIFRETPDLGVKPLGDNDFVWE